MRLRAEVSALNELSGHVDQQDLLKWVRPIAPKLKRVFLVHGEPGAPKGPGCGSGGTVEIECGMPVARGVCRSGLQNAAVKPFAYGNSFRMGVTASTDKAKRGLSVFFSPKSVAVIGATEKAGHVGRAILWNLISSPFGGTVYPVNPKRTAVLGIRAYPSVLAVPEHVDLAVIVTPAESVPQIDARMCECWRYRCRDYFRGFPRNWSSRPRVGAGNIGSGARRRISGSSVLTVSG